jgi:hypothetical protein
VSRLLGQQQQFMCQAGRAHNGSAGRPQGSGGSATAGKCNLLVHGDWIGAQIMYNRINDC